MPALYQLTAGLHILAAVIWIGGMLFLALVLGPYARSLDPARRTEIFAETGLRFRAVSWVAIGMLVITGLGNLSFRGAWASVLDTTSTLFWKLLLVAVMIILSFLHDFALGPRALANPEATFVRSLSGWLGRLNVLLGLGVLYLAMRLARGG